MVINYYIGNNNSTKYDYVTFIYFELSIVKFNTCRPKLIKFILHIPFFSFLTPDFTFSYCATNIVVNNRKITVHSSKLVLGTFFSFLRK